MELLHIFGYSIVPTLATLYITEKIKGRLKNDFDRKLELLKSENNVNLAKFQVDLNALKIKENFKFTKLHEKRFDVLEKTYILIHELLVKLNDLVQPLKFIPLDKNHIENDSALQTLFLDKHKEVIIYFVNNKIYLSNDTKKLIDEYIKEVNITYNLYNEKLFFLQNGEKPDRETTSKANLAYKEIEKKIKPILKNIEENFAEIFQI